MDSVFIVNIIVNSWNRKSHPTPPTLPKMGGLSFRNSTKQAGVQISLIKWKGFVLKKRRTITFNIISVCVCVCHLLHFYQFSLCVFPRKDFVLFNLIRRYLSSAREIFLKKRYFRDLLFKGNFSIPLVPAYDLLMFLFVWYQIIEFALWNLY